MIKGNDIRVEKEIEDNIIKSVHPALNHGPKRYLYS